MRLCCPLQNQDMVKDDKLLNFWLYRNEYANFVIF